MKNKRLILILTISVLWTISSSEQIIAQSSSSETHTVEGDANSCELNSLYLDMMTNEHRANNERVFVIARLGRGETSRSLLRHRLGISRVYLNGRIKSDRILFAEGDRVNGKGRVE
jgi:hypothetical protein